MLKMSTTSKFVSEQGYSLIIDHLYLTSADNITDEKLSEYNIKYIVNATTSVPLNKSCVIDFNTQKIMDFFETVNDFISKALENNDNVVVHCISGISRSSTLVIAYLMKCRKMTLKDAYELVRSKRPIIRPNVGFFLQLHSYETKLFNTNSVQLVWCQEAQAYVPDIIANDIRYKFVFFYSRR